MKFERTLIARKDLPLYGKRVLFCTPRNYAQKLAGLLVRHGALPIWMPTIVIEPMDDYSGFDEAIRRLADYAWISFTSRNGIEAFFNRLDALGLDASILKNTRVSALGNDGKALEARGVTVDLLPPAASTRGVVEELRRRGETSGKILLPVPEVYGMEEPSVIPDYVALLEELGMQPCRVPAYATRRVTTGLDPELELLTGGKLDLVAFSSVAEIDSLLYLLADRRDALDHLTVACYGPVTASGAKERGLSVAFTADNYSAFEGFIDAMENHFRSVGT
ncbi:MAG TPA: uroporphyrinogen-III synthase [Chromatiales bacterium]|nr:uroporphyrinogen-III synthase [Chromatiales bacterium]